MSEAAPIRLRDLGEWMGGNTPSKANAAYWTDGTIPWVSPKDMKVDEIASSEDRVTETALAEGRVSMVPEGSVLLVTRSGILAHTLPVAVTKLPVTINQDLKALTPKAGVSPKYVAHAVRSASRQILKQCSKYGTTVASIETNALLDFKIPMVELDEQHRIVAEIEKQFSRLDEAVANLKRVKATLKRYKAAILRAAVEGRLVPTDGLWIHAQLGAVARSIRNGYSKKPDAEHGTRILRISAVRPMEIDLNDVRYLSGALADYEPFLVEAGDVLFTRYNGNREYVGVCACIPADVAPTVYPDKLIRVRVSSATMLPQFLAIVASTGRTREYIKSKTRTTAGQSGISGGDLKSLPLDIPSVSEQTRIVAEVNRLFSLASGIEAEITASSKRGERLRHTILAKFFVET